MVTPTSSPRFAPPKSTAIPLIPIEHYMHWRRDDGLPFDPRIRAHERVDGEILRSAPAAMRVAGTVSEWEQWTGLAMPGSGEYLIPGGHVSVSVDRERDLGVYLELACWVRHRVQEPHA
jgi:hypothetical protein